MSAPVIKPDVAQSPMLNRESEAYLLKEDAAEEAYNRRPLWLKVVMGLLVAAGAFAALIVFLVAVKFVGDGFRLVLGCSMKTAFEFADNPIAGLMVGVVVTALFQSSSSVTSIAVALASADALTVKQAIPVVMGANIGTCVTSTLVAFGQIGDRVQFERAMAAGTVHDIFNMMNVLVLLPIELIFHPLQRIAEAMSGTESGGATFKSPIDKITKPIIAEFVKVDSSLQNAIAAGEKNCTSSTKFYKSGAFENSGMNDDAIGAILIVLGVVLLVLALWVLVKMLSFLFLGSTKKLVKKVLSFNGYVTIVFGFAMTFAVQSSSITTATFTPIAGLGVISLEQMYPLVLGANVGTTGTALLAALAGGKKTGLALAFVHLWFNIFGILIWYPVPFMRNVIMGMARTLAHWCASWKMVAVGFIITVVILIPGVLFAVSSMATADATGLKVFGWVLAVAVVLSVAGFVYWFRMRGGKTKWEELLGEKRAEAIAKENKEVGESVQTPSHV